MDRIENIKKEQKKHLSYNLQMLKERSGLSVRDFCKTIGLAPATYTRYINLDTNNLPTLESARPLLDYFQITYQQLINADLPDDFFELHPDIYFSLFTNEEIDNQIIDLIEHYYEIKIINVIKAFAEMEINVDMIPQIELSTRHYNEQNINNTYYATYTVDNFIRTISFISKSKQTEIAEKYITHYKNTYTQKYVLVREIQKTKSIPPLAVRFRTLQTPTDIDPDIYKTIKTMSLDQFLKYCAKYKEDILKKFHINIPE